MRLRTKINDSNNIDCIIIAADNDLERTMLKKIYDLALKQMSELNGKPIYPFKQQETSIAKIPSEQMPKATNRRKEGYRKSRATKNRNKQSSGPG
jgi:hypothetical protein